MRLVRLNTYAAVKDATIQTVSCKGDGRGRLDEAENRRYDSKKGQRYDGRHVICKITHISELLIRRKGHAMGVSTDGNGRR
jgi:hypothetical protein